MTEKKGMKFDTGKAMYDLIDPACLEELAQVLTMGAIKYNRDNWKQVEPYKYEAALFRHFQAYRKGEIIDPESGLHHLSHVMANTMFLYCHNKMENPDE
ncbi:MAG: hypothetical protein Unbinned8261contig1001_10 [Prokaryotic dsDNA virus sp.]|nr:MAG: hypothetical protein Unbinned8261contig1001_10 [Prokaryotic dsDNA virus sp.]|tara:strand:- start:17073 stop:17369 length:297 start_codon:yes stop_codon:yes gene_type:complete